MRLLGAVLVALVFAVPASATRIKPFELVLQQNDVPARYMFDKDNTLAFSNVRRTDLNAEERRLIVRYDLRSGYVARYTDSDPPHWKYVDSSALVFGREAGATSYLHWLDRTIRTKGPRSMRRTAVHLGAEGWTYTTQSLDTGTLVFWRHGRVVANVGCRMMAQHRTLALALARKQQRRIAAAVP